MSENQREAIKEEIKYRTEIIKLLTILLLSVGGGTFSWGLKHYNKLFDILLIAIGVITFFLLGFAVIIEHFRVIRLIRLLKEEKENARL